MRPVLLIDAGHHPMMWTYPFQPFRVERSQGGLSTIGVSILLKNQFCRNIKWTMDGCFLTCCTYVCIMGLDDVSDTPIVIPIFVHFDPRNHQKHQDSKDSIEDMPKQDPRR